MGTEAVMSRSPSERIQRSAAEYLGRDVNVVIVAIKKSLRFVAERENHAPAVDYDIYGPDSSGAA